MKGSLFPLGQPLRELEDQPMAGYVPRLQPLPAACGCSGCPGLSASDPWPISLPLEPPGVPLRPRNQNPADPEWGAGFFTHR